MSESWRHRIVERCMRCLRYALRACAASADNTVLTSTPAAIRDPTEEHSAHETRGSDIGFVFQDPSSNLHPLMPIGRQVGEALTAHHRLLEECGQSGIVAGVEEPG